MIILSGDHSYRDINSVMDSRTKCPSIHAVVLQRWGLSAWWSSGQVDVVDVPGLLDRLL